MVRIFIYPGKFCSVVWWAPLVLDSHSYYWLDLSFQARTMEQFYFFLLWGATVLCGWVSLPLDTRGNSRLGMTSGMLQSSLMWLPYPLTSLFSSGKSSFQYSVEKMTFWGGRRLLTFVKTVTVLMALRKRKGTRIRERRHGLKVSVRNICDKVLEMVVSCIRHPLSNFWFGCFKIPKWVKCDWIWNQIPFRDRGYQNGLIWHTVQASQVGICIT